MSQSVAAVQADVEMRVGAAGVPSCLCFGSPAPPSSRRFGSHLVGLSREADLEQICTLDMYRADGRSSGSDSRPKEEAAISRPV